jgi:hypothetical protein
MKTTDGCIFSKDRLNNFKEPEAEEDTQME